MEGLCARASVVVCVLGGGGWCLGVLVEKNIIKPIGVNSCFIPLDKRQEYILR